MERKLPANLIRGEVFDGNKVVLDVDPQATMRWVKVRYVALGYKGNPLTSKAKLLIGRTQEVMAEMPKWSEEGWYLQNGHGFKTYIPERFNPIFDYELKVEEYIIDY